MIFENVKLAFSSIRANKMRSFLTMLGMIIGISSVITIVSLGDTMRGMVSSEFENVGMGAAYLYINSGNDYYTDAEMFSLEDGKILKEGLGDSLTYVGFNATERADMTAGRKTESAYINGVAENPTVFIDPEIVYGRMLNNRDFQERRKYIVIEDTLALTLFGKENAVGEMIKTTINQEAIELMVVGVYENTDSVLMQLLMGNSFSETYVPESLMFTENNLSWMIYFAMNEDGNMEQTRDRVQAFVSRFKGVDIENVVCYTALEQMTTIDGMLSSLSLVVGAIAAISLLVGGIGIMNIMLVSVTERTREIGIRKALGAKTKDILVQFLIESAAISLAGGAIGTGLGISLVALGATAFGVGVVVRPTIVVIAVIFSMGVGLLFGIYPARKAAKKDPVEALRYE